jgi:prolyl oligopeptidase
MSAHAHRGLGSGSNFWIALCKVKKVLASWPFGVFPMFFDERPTILEPDDDPYLWLEEIEGSRALAFVDAQNAVTLARFSNAGLTADRDALAAIYDRPDNIPIVTRRGSDLYNFWKDANNPRGLWRRTTLESFRSERPQWEIVLDLDELAAKEAEDWIWSGSSTLPRIHDRAILRLSRGGGDAVVLREFDIATKAFASGGFHLSEAKGGAEWLDRTRCCSQAPSARYGHRVRLCENGSVVAARGRCREGVGAVRDDAGQHERLGGRRSNAGNREGLVRRKTGVF